MNKLLLTSLVMSFAVAQASAQTSTTTENQAGETKVKIEDLKEKNKVEGNIDEEITNARMRAESGSKSKWSMSLDLAYTGGDTQKPFGMNRPNLAVGEPGNQVQTSMDVGVSGRYRWSKNDSMTFGTSFGFMTPFQGDVDSNENQMNVFDPGVGYNRTFAAGGLQNSLTLAADFGTSDEAQAIERLGSTAFSATTLKSWKNGLATGISTTIAYRFYGNEAGEQTEGGTAARGFYGGDRRTDWSLGIYPFAEYAFNDQYSLRTVFGYFNWRHLYGDAQTTRLLQTFVYQSIGVGMALTRDLYLYPNIQFIPDDIRSDLTNVALSAQINIF
jgi:hypothetical protein